MSEEFDDWENIDWNVEIDTLEFDLMAIKSHNKTNPNVGKKWTEWPKDMLGLMLLPLGYQPSKWLARWWISTSDKPNHVLARRLQGRK